jgi:hypothetical protein
MPASEMTHQAIFGKRNFGEERPSKASAERSKTSCSRELDARCEQATSRGSAENISIQEIITKFPVGVEFFG